MTKIEAALGYRDAEEADAHHAHAQRIADGGTNKTSAESPAFSGGVIPGGAAGARGPTAPSTRTAPNRWSVGKDRDGGLRTRNDESVSRAGTQAVASSAVDAKAGSPDAATHGSVLRSGARSGGVDDAGVAAPNASVAEAARETVRRLWALAKRIDLDAVDFAWLTDDLLAALDAPVACPFEVSGPASRGNREPAWVPCSLRKGHEVDCK